MGEQQKDQTLRRRASQASEKVAESKKGGSTPPAVEAQSAATVLALAVTSAQQEAPTLKTPSEGRPSSNESRPATDESRATASAAPPSAKPAAESASGKVAGWGRGAKAATLAIAVGLGWLVGTRTASHEGTPQAILNQWSEASA